MPTSTLLYNRIDCRFAIITYISISVYKMTTSRQCDFVRILVRLSVIVAYFADISNPSSRQKIMLCMWGTVCSGFYAIIILWGPNITRCLILDLPTILLPVVVWLLTSNQKRTIIQAIRVVMHLVRVVAISNHAVVTRAIEKKIEVALRNERQYQAYVCPNIPGCQIHFKKSSWWRKNLH